MLQFLQQIGSGSVLAFWVPVVVWTCLAGVATAGLTLARGLHPLSGYRLRQALLLTLPASILTGPWLPEWSLPVVRGPAIEPLGPESALLPDPAVPSAGSGVDGGVWMPTNVGPWLDDALRASEIDLTATLMGSTVILVIVLAFVRLWVVADATRRLYLLRRTAPRVDDRAANQLLRKLSIQLGVRRTVDLREGPPGCVPMTFGAWRPIVVVPRVLLETPRALQTVLTHELIHVRRGDQSWALLDCLTTAVFAFHPLVWLLWRGIQRWRETSCDAEVLSVGNVPANRYARLLVRTYAANQRVVNPLAATTFARRSFLKQRLEAIGRFANTQRPTRQPYRVVLASVCLFAGLALACGSATVRHAPGVSPLAPEQLPVLDSGEVLQPGVRFKDCDVCPDMMVVPAGSFRMGSPIAEMRRYSDEGPQRWVQIVAPFAVGIYEVTFTEWDACVGAGGCEEYRSEDREGRDRGPVVNVNWGEVQEYVRWLSQETGENYRLLTEAEWEYVARAGTQTAWFWGQREVEQCRYANGYDRTADATYSDWGDPAPCDDRYAEVAPVGSFEPNAYGLFDMMGNVWEWTQDCWNDDHSEAPQDGRARESGDCSQRMLRGGSWFSRPWLLRSALRDEFGVERRSREVGFRVARSTHSTSESVPRSLPVPVRSADTP